MSISPFQPIAMDQVKALIISRPDSIGDVVLTLPLAGRIKERYPHIQILFLGQSYTRAVIEQCIHVDGWMTAEDLPRLPQTPDLILHVLPDPHIALQALRLGIPWRVGTHRRAYHWITCNRWVRLSRKNSPMHEAQLNLRLLEPMGIEQTLSREEIPAYYGLKPGEPLTEDYQDRLDPHRYNLLLHPKSAGSAREWPLERFQELIEILDPKKFNIMITGSAKEKPLLKPLVDWAGDRVQDLSGQMSLPTLLRFIHEADGLIANSTGPLHLAAALGRHAMGIYPPIRPMDPGRWAPLGPGASYWVLDKECQSCRRQPETCACIRDIQAQVLGTRLEENYHIKFPEKYGG